ncbi:uncharacterized protein LOC111637718 [Centruroides sculpturatus]|uniref:uncharacterized protein LOC111637718 n=1 Tax=Centruroides sculpturatus TaxID=218467 RepID=UPI000C6DE81A|nr:uncharacterized protein LOC111637718 [Centruroides sculpturatus]
MDTVCCSGCQYNYFEATAFSEERGKEELLRHGIWRKETKCGRCGNLLRAEGGRELFRCGKVIRKGKKRAAPCGWSKSIWAGTFFSHSNLSLVTLWRFIFSLLVWKPPRQATLHRFLGLSKRTIVDWYSFYREVCVHDVSSQTEKLGGEGRVVEVDEAKIGRRKYHKGRISEGQWIFGGIERESRKRFLVPVETRDSQTLLSVLKEWVLPGTTVISDCWKAYDCLQTEGFHHLTVNHKYNFVDPQMGSHTNTIERMWREVRANVPRYGVRKEHMVGYLAEYLFKAKYPDMGSRLHHFQVAAANLYPPGY